MTTPQTNDLAIEVGGSLKAFHKGSADGITARQLAQRFGCPERDIRHAVEHLRMGGKPVGAHPGKGYYWCITPEDFAATEHYLKHRALKTLVQLSHMTKKGLPELFGQLQMEFTEPQHQVAAPAST